MSCASNKSSASSSVDVFRLSARSSFFGGRPSLLNGPVFSPKRLTISSWSSAGGRPGAKSSAAFSRLERLKLNGACTARADESQRRVGRLPSSEARRAKCIAPPMEESGRGRREKGGGRGGRGQREREREREGERERERGGRCWGQTLINLKIVRRRENTCFTAVPHLT
eukprot:scaffold109160_cov34-Tisochrysis_lutea.AAC.1